MAFSLYDATIPSFQQTLGAVSGLLVKAEAFCADAGIDSAVMVSSKLADDMLPFGYQVKSVASHSIGAIKGVRAFLEGFVVAEPTGKQNTFAAHNPPEFVAISVRSTIRRPVRCRTQSQRPKTCWR